MPVTDELSATVRAYFVGFVLKLYLVSFVFIMSRWGDEKTIQFIHLYREHECLWNPSSSLYKNKIARDNCYRIIEEEFQVNLKEIKNKIKSLRSTYHQELNKVQKSKRSRAGLGDVYKPSLIWFKEMEFLNETFEYRQPVHTELQPSSPTNSAENNQSQLSSLTNTLIVEQANPFSQPNAATAEQPQQSSQKSIATVEPPSSSSQVATITPVQNKRKRGHENETLTALQRLEEISINTTINAGPKEDEFYYFGQSVAAQLRTLPLPNAIDLQSKIQMLISTERSHLMKNRRIEE